MKTHETKTSQHPEERYYTVTEYFNCRKFNKRYYTLTRQVDEGLLQALERQFGEASIQHFSRFSAQAKDSFRITNPDGVQVSGVLSGGLLYLVTPLKDQTQINRFETLVRQWTDTTGFV